MEELHPDLSALLGRTIAGRYRVDELIGQGAMSAVFRGRHLGLERDVALKVQHPDMARDEDIVSRFDREAHAASRLDHPNCLQVTDVGITDTGLKFMVMHLLDGKALSYALGVPIAVERSLTLMLQVLRGLEHAHDRGVIHRDVKPENIIVTTDHEGHEIVKLVDFGLAKLVGDAAVGYVRVTKSGVVFGTPAYMSPEQALGEEADARSDLYSVGVVLYEMINGTPPFVSGDVVEVVRMQVTHEPPPLAENVPQVVVDFILRLLSKQAEDRYQSAQQAREALEIIIPIIMPTDVILLASLGAAMSSPSLPAGESGDATALSASLAVGASATRARAISVTDVGSGDEASRPTARQQTRARPGAGRWIVRGLLAMGLGAGAVAGVSMLDREDEPDDDAAIADEAERQAPTSDASDRTGVAEADLAELDRLILAGQIDAADKVIAPLLDRYPEDARLVWRQGRLLAPGKKTRGKALAAYGRALDLDPRLLDDAAFAKESGELLRVPSLRDDAIDIALRKMGAHGHDFLLEVVNDERRPLGYSDRHRVLDVLAESESHASRVDARLNTALDLLQASQSLAPCGSFGAALDRIVAEPDAWYLTRVQHAPVPDAATGGADPADDPVCESLAQKRDAALLVLAPLAVAEEASAAAEPAPTPAKKKKRAKKRRGR